MRGLKALVIIMGALIVVGFAVVVVTLVNRSGVNSSASRDSAPSPRTQATTPYKTRIPIPAGSRITETSAADGRLIIRLTLGDSAAGTAGAAGAARILVIDLATGRQIGTIDLPEARP